jgi:hypothetical protein
MPNVTFETPVGQNINIDSGEVRNGDIVLSGGDSINGFGPQSVINGDVILSNGNAAFCTHVRVANVAIRGNVICENVNTKPIACDFIRIGLSGGKIDFGDNYIQDMLFDRVQWLKMRGTQAFHGYGNHNFMIGCSVEQSVQAFGEVLGLMEILGHGWTVDQSLIESNEHAAPGWYFGPGPGLAASGPFRWRGGWSEWNSTGSQGWWFDRANDVQMDAVRLLHGSRKLKIENCRDFKIEYLDNTGELVDFIGNIDLVNSDLAIGRVQGLLDTGYLDHPNVTIGSHRNIAGNYVLPNPIPWVTKTSVKSKPIQLKTGFKASAKGTTITVSELANEQRGEWIWTLNQASRTFELEIYHSNGAFVEIYDDQWNQVPVRSYNTGFKTSFKTMAKTKFLRFLLHNMGTYSFINLVAGNMKGD